MFEALLVVEENIELLPAEEVIDVFLGYLPPSLDFTYVPAVPDNVTTRGRNED